MFKIRYTAGSQTTLNRLSQWGVGALAQSYVNLKSTDKNNRIFPI